MATGCMSPTKRNVLVKEEIKVQRQNKLVDAKGQGEDYDQESDGR